MSAEPIETAHLPNFIQEAAGKLHRYINSGELLAKSELQRLMADLHGLVHQLPAEEGAVENEATDFEGRVAEGVRKALPEAEAMVTRAKEWLATAEADLAATKAALVAKTAEVETLEQKLAAALSKPALVIDATVSGEAKPLPQLDVTQSTATAQGSVTEQLAAAQPPQPA